MLKRNKIIKELNTTGNLPAKRFATPENLFYSLMIDGIGVAFVVTPVVGELMSVPWALISGFLVGKIYGSFGWGILNSIEEMLPFTDFIPSATIAWLHYRFKEKIYWQSQAKPISGHGTERRALPQ